MKRIVLISCVSSKGKEKAKDIYKGPLFTNSLAYGISLKPDKILYSFSSSWCIGS